MSYWLRVKPVHRARAVTVDDIAQKAVDILDELGIEALTLRALAGRLGVAAASLYSRIDRVDDVVDIALDHALPLTRLEHGTRGHLDLLIAYYRHLLVHPWTVTATARRPPRGPAHLRLSETLCHRLHADGVDDVVTTAYAMSNFVLGSAATAQAAAREPHAPANPELAPLYDRLRRQNTRSPDDVVEAGLKALRHMAA